MLGPADLETTRSEATAGAEGAGAGRVQVEGRLLAAERGTCAECPEFSRATPRPSSRSGTPFPIHSHLQLLTGSL